MAETRTIGKRIFWCAAAVVVVGLLSRCDAPAPLVSEESYPAPWQTDANVKISRALVANQVSGCGEYIYRQHRRDPMAYLVHCSRGGAIWTAYLVDIKSGSVDGPYRPTLKQ